MQRNIKNKITFFAFGLLAGITLGVVFAVAIKTVFGHLNDLRKGMLNIGSKEDKISQRLDSLEGKLSNQSKTKVIVVPDRSSAKTVDVSNSAGTPVRVIKADSTASLDKKDSLPLMKSLDDSTDVVVMTNQLETVSNVALVDLDSTKAKRSKAAVKSDSMIAAMNDLPQQTTASNYRIEFWQTPLNFKGYKMSIGKIILYGVSSKTILKLVKWDESYYLLANQIAYRVDYTDDMRPFNRVTDKSVLKKLSL